MKLVFAEKVFFSIQNIINHYFFSFVKFFLQKKKVAALSRTLFLVLF